MAKILLENGAQVDPIDDLFSTPLHIAVQHGKLLDMYNTIVYP